MAKKFFTFKKLRKDNIVIEEDSIDSPFLIFLKKHNKLIMAIVVLLALLSIGLSMFLVIKNLKETTKVVTNIDSVVVEFEDTDELKSVNMKPITGGLADKLFYKRYGNVGLTEGVIFAVKEVKTKNGIITFYSDGSSKLNKVNGEIIRISAFTNGDYGINEEGSVLLGAIIKEIHVTKEITLKDKTKLIYYSDNSCSIIIPDKKINLLVRNSDRIVISKDNRFVETLPSGVTKPVHSEIKENYSIIYYEDGTIKIIYNNKVHVVRDKNDFIIENNKIKFPNNNDAIILKEITLRDGSKIVYYTDGSAELTNSNESFMIRQSKDIIYIEDNAIEVVETKYFNEVFSKKIFNTEVKYLNNGGALLKYSDGTYKYVYENENVRYNKNDFIGKDSFVNEKKHFNTPDGTLVIDLEDKMSLIITTSGYLLVETDKIVYDADGNIVKILGDEELEGEIDSSITSNKFDITNNSGKDIKYIITIEVSDDYKKYASKWLNPKFLRYNLVQNSNYLENQKIENKLEIGTKLEGDTIIQKDTYILYEGKLKNKEKASINLGMWLDYTDITNEYQDSVFVGTIKVYSETINK